MFRRWARLTGNDELVDDPRFADDKSRAVHGKIISQLMNTWCATRSTADVLKGLEGARIPSAPVYAPQQALDDPHIAALDYLRPIDFPGLDKPAPIADTPVKLSGTPGRISGRAPLLGEHTDLILAELGYSKAEIVGFRGAKIV